MQMNTRLLASLALTALAQWAVAAETTYEQIRSPSPDNWLSVHRTYDAQRFSPLAQIDRTSVRNLQLKYAIGIGGSAANESLEATPLVEDGFVHRGMRPDDILITMGGGDAGGHSCFIPSWSRGRGSIMQHAAIRPRADKK